MASAVYTSQGDLKTLETDAAKALVRIAWERGVEGAYVMYMPFMCSAAG